MSSPSAGIEVEHELPKARQISAKLRHGQPCGFALAMGFEPAPHPDVTMVWLPDFDKSHEMTTAWTPERVIAETGLDVLPPGKGFR